MEELIIKFLKMNYPIHRYKEKKHFKRTIINSNGDKFYLSNSIDIKNLYNQLFNTLELIFCEDKKIIERILKIFLYLK
jgi:hypothetical protein